MGIVAFLFIHHLRSESSSITVKDVEESQQEERFKAEVNEILLPLENSEFRLEPVTHVVIHYMSNAVEKPHDPYKLEDIYSIFLASGLSSHYVIDRKGNIYQLVAEERIAYHAGAGRLTTVPNYEDKLNDYSIGIELLAIGTKDEMKPLIDEQTYEVIPSQSIGFTEDQYQSLKELLDDIQVRHPDVHLNRDHIVGHDEYAPKRKNDPGSLFDWDKLGF